MNIIEKELDNGYNVKLIENSELIITEVWIRKIYERDFKIEEGMNILDLGANQGLFSLYAASKGAHVISVEPEEINFKILSENIARNNLKNKITAFKYAISSRPGNIELYMFDFKEPFAASGMVTSSMDLLKRNILFDKSKKNGIQTETVESIRLDALFGVINMKKIDLLKIDCEGAEIDILLSASRETLKNVNCIVMETHEAYAEKDLFYLVKDLGFNVITYDKFGGNGNTGYLFAENKKINGKAIWDKPVALFDMVPSMQKGEKITVDASKSFSTQNNPIRYKWFIDGKDVIGKNTNTLDISFDNAGSHSVALEVMDDNNKKSDGMEKKIWVFDENYFNNKIEYKINLNDVNKKSCYSVNGTACFMIIMPEKTIIFEEIIIRIDYMKRDNFSSLFKFNGEISELSKKSNEIQINDFPGSNEIIFSIETENSEKIGIMAWSRDKYREIHVDNINPDLIYLKQKDYYLDQRIKEKSDFIIHHNYFPVDWVPKYIVIEITIIDIENGPLDGSFEYSGKVEKLNDTFMKLKIHYIDCAHDVLFTIKNNQKDRNLKIVWWLSMD